VRKCALAWGRPRDKNDRKQSIKSQITLSFTFLCLKQHCYDIAKTESSIDILVVSKTVVADKNIHNNDKKS